MLVIRYIPTNQCYAVFFGNTQIDLDRQYLFSSKEEIKDIIKHLGLALKGDKIVSK